MMADSIDLFKKRLDKFDLIYLKLSHLGMEVYNNFFIESICISRTLIFEMR